MRDEDMHYGVMPYLAGAVLIFVLLLTLHQVLKGAVRQGASLKVSYAERNETNWRCSAAHGPRERDDCIAQRTDTSSNQLMALADMHKP